MESLDLVSKLINNLIFHEHNLLRLSNSHSAINHLREIRFRMKWVSSSEDELKLREEVMYVIYLFLSTPAKDMVQRIIKETASGKDDHYKGDDYFKRLNQLVDVFLVRDAMHNNYNYKTQSESTGDDSNAEKSINAWITGFETSQKLQVDKKYELLFRVGDSDFINLLSGDNSKIALAEIPESGLETEWLISSTEVEMGQYAIDDKINVEPMPSDKGWAAKFQLVIPRDGDSETVKLFIIPTKSGKVQLDVLLYTLHNIQSPIDGTIHLVNELYRQFKINLEVGEASSQTTSYSGLNNLVQNEKIYSPASQVNLIPSHEWTTPPGELNLTILENGRVAVTGDAGHERVGMITNWGGVKALVAGPLENVINSADKFRANWNAYLNDVDGASINTRLGNFMPQYDWGHLSSFADAAHEQNWQTVANSKELKELALDAYTLYNVFFPLGSDIRSVFDKLIPGQKINIYWLQSSGDGYVPHVPWGLLYTKQPDSNPVDACSFWGLRYRIEYTSRDIKFTSKALGKLENSFNANLFYWDNKPDDLVYKEAEWQQQQFSALQTKKVFLPTKTGDAAKTEMVSMLSKPVKPLALMYLYCHCSVGEGNTPILRFGASSAPEFTLSRFELMGTPFDDKPLVFANACTTATADPYKANELAETFFRRQCRAYIGTEIKVPIVFASRFAFIFFNFFYRKIDPEPMAGGEAIAQTRLWLWVNYRNIGGLFYNYVNQYELFMADGNEVEQLKKGHG